MSENKAKRRKLLTKRDIVLIAVILSIGFFLLGIRHWINNPVFYNHNESGNHIVYAEINSDFGVYIVYLDDNRTFYVDMLPNVLFEISDGRIAFIKSDCPDQICVRTGFISRTGQMAACLPNGVLVFILSLEDIDIDDLDVFVR